MTFTLDYADDKQLVAKLAAILSAKGYCVTKESPSMVTVSDAARLVARPMSTVSRSLHRPSCPPFAAVRSDTGRILRLELNDALVAYLSKRPE